MYEAYEEVYKLMECETPGSVSGVGHVHDATSMDSIVFILNYHGSSNFLLNLKLRKSLLISSSSFKIKCRHCIAVFPLFEFVKYSLYILGRVINN